MRLTLAGAALSGTTELAVNGVVPSTLVGINAGNPQPYSPTHAIFQNVTAGSVLQTLRYSDSVLTTVSSQGQNFLGAGNSVYYAALPPVVRTNVTGLGPFNPAGLGDVSLQGIGVVITEDVGFKVYSAAGALLSSITAVLSGDLRCRDGLVAYPIDVNGDNAWTLRTTAGVIQPLRYQAATLLMIPLVVGGVTWVVEYVNDVGLYVRRATEAQGFLLPATANNAFNADAVALSSTQIRVVASSGAGELPTEVRVFDVTVANGTFQSGVTSSGSLVFTSQPALTPKAVTIAGGSASGSGADAITGAYRWPIADPTSDPPFRITPAWYQAFLKVARVALGPIDLSSARTTGVLDPDNGGTGTDTGLSELDADNLTTGLVPQARRWLEQVITDTGSVDDQSLSLVVGDRQADSLLCDNATALDITGIAAGVGGQNLILAAVGAGAVTLKNADGSSAAANQILTGTGADVLLAAGTAALLHYEADTARWRVVSAGNSLGSGYWTILTNGDPVTPEVVFDSNGDVIPFFVPA